MRRTLSVAEVAEVLKVCDHKETAQAVQSFGSRVKSTADLIAALQLLHMLLGPSPGRPVLALFDLHKRLEPVHQLCRLLGGCEELFAAFDEILGKPRPAPPPPPPPPPAVPDLVAKLARPTGELELSVRAANVLEGKYGVGSKGSKPVRNLRYLFDLVLEPEADLVKRRHCGKKTIKEIKEILTAMDLSLDMQIDEATIAAVRAEIAQREKPTGT